ncbi:hypothetical protein GALMADRAFT_244494 [Galerina marginata CBS 339.88]|uniref:MI domain-containing protein n=1 Tax=Galerina marginata (strain CBS 339.88) TaxID=685588 RepID=A0A067TG29_GALM3|nr:hypothetical protein GALMADRAFT_244494 [Galerina marginata CBS 339.88]
MAIRKKTSTTKLPQSLLAEVGQVAGNDHSHNRRPHFTSRKEARKSGRDAQKQRKAEYFSQTPNARKRHAEEEHAQSPQRKKAHLTKHNHKSDTKHNTISNGLRQPEITYSKPSAKVPTIVLKTSKKVSTTEKVVKIAQAKSPVEEKEDAYIAYLEAKLGLGKGKRKSKSMEEEDGLDDLMDWADSFIPSAPPATQTLNNDSDDEGSLSGSSSSSSENSDDYGEEEWRGIDNLQSFSDSTQEIQEAVSQPSEKPVIIAGTYVPPHLRNTQRDNDNTPELIQKLSRQLKGLLNRMSEQNISTIIDSVEGVYREHRRNDVTSTLTTLIINGISAHSSLLDSYVVLHAAFVASLHKIIGLEFAAHFVQSTVASYEQCFVSMFADSGENGGKECSNLLVLISELYNFQVVSSVLVFDVIRNLLADDLTEFTVELLLKIVRNSGQQLRQDDPSALKDIIQIVQGKISTTDDAVSSRTRFMIETLTNLKNNKLKKNVTQNQGGAAVERMKKFLSGLSKTKHVLAHEPLRISLVDLHSAETKGKWWLIGAAWGGDPLIDKQDEFAKSTVNQREEERMHGESADLIKLARTQGMNTDIRRGIFVILMSSDDYIDACERLSQLNLSEIQQREIIRVVLHCCGNERSYNPYYTLVCQQLCRASHAYKITLQFSLWDFLRDLGQTTVGGAAVIKNLTEADGFDVKNVSEIRLKNVAKAYAWWIAKDSVTVQILKPVDFTMLKPRTHEFLKELLTQIFINSQRTTPLVTSDFNNVTFTRNRNAIEEIFIKGSRVQALAMGLVYFFSEAFKATPDPDSNFSRFLRWAVDVAKEALRTGVDLLPTL